ncbi:MAG TPA: 50S ribosomal protein L23 [Anaerolineales bacterium]|nr:50S ribosomal protein L23 [Anaerolineales bacterium]
MNVYEILRRPLVTEKSVKQSGQRQYGFVVDRRATKTEIKDAIQTLFNVDVVRVNTLVVPAKRGLRGGRRSRRVVVRNSPYKKAFVTVAEGQMIDVFEGVK